MNALKQLSYVAVAATTTVLYSNTFATAASAGMGFQGTGNDNGEVNSRLKGTETPLVEKIQSMMSFLTNFLYLIAVAFVLYGGFLMLTAGGEEDKVKKGKTILMQAVMGLIVVFLASTLVTFVIDQLFKA